jgi:hypothetical protein
MNTRKIHWLCYGNCVINLDHVNAFHKTDDDVIVSFTNGGSAVLKNTTLDDIRHYLKYGKPKRR